MKHSSVFVRMVRFCTAILVGVLILSSTPEQPRAAVQAWTRTLEPVIVTGSQLPLFTNVVLGDLFVYAFNGSTWSVVPFQFDEVNTGGSFVPYENGRLDANDQLVFMAADLGVMAAAYEWPDDANSRSHSRYEVHVTNPLSPSEDGWAYVYYSTTLAPTFAPYVTWNSASTSTSASTYIIGYAPTEHLGIDSLQLNGYAGDVLDRSKFRLRIFCIDSDGGENRTLITENSAEVTDSWTPPDIHGPVRVGGGTLDEYSWSYASMFTDESTFTVTEPDPEDCIEFNYEFLRATEDWLNPVASGMAPMGYFDSNWPAGVVVDGIYDSIPSTPFPTWRQVSGLKGSVVQVTVLDTGGAAINNYYKDLADEDPDDTGDLRSFGDAGFLVISPVDPVLISTVHYVLDPLQASVGGTYREYYMNPLQAEATAQEYFERAPNGVAFTYSPVPTFQGLETTFTATVDGQPPFTYDWTFGDGGGVASGNPVIHTFTVSVTVPVSLTVTNDYGTAALSQRVIVFPEGTEPPYTYLPLVFKHAP
jgi:hypothetical protein